MNLKEEYNKKFISRLADEFFLVDNSFHKKQFVDELINNDWEVLELKQRMRKITQTLFTYLPYSYSKQLEILQKVASNSFRIQGLVFPDFVQVYGLNDYKASIQALEVLTEYSTSEYAIRPFIEKYPTEALNQLKIWSKSKNHHVRRLASEGSRPKLPWAPLLHEFVKNPKPVLPVLEQLKNDDSLYVRKSVANHLNDISKNHPDLVIDICKSWYGKTKNTDWIVKHALRTLLKKGNKNALEIFGTHQAENIEVEEFCISKNELKIGGELAFTFNVLNNNKADKTLRLEYIIHFAKSNGNTSPKIFKISENVLKSNEAKTVTRKHKFADLSTRKHHKGKHQLSIVVNGDVKHYVEFDLI